jgi:hypothetical protein
MRVYVVGFRPDDKHDNPGGTGGFEWFYAKPRADWEYAAEVKRERGWIESEGSGFECARWDHDTDLSNPAAITDEIDSNLDEAHDAATIQWHASEVTA